MKLKLFLILLLTAQFAWSAEDFDGYAIDTINISATRIKPAVAQERFGLKSGDIFTQEKYQKAQDNLHNLRVFKTLDFAITPKDDKKLDINIDGQDGYYIFPLAFVTGGSKSAFALSVAEGNLFKHGETAFLFAAAGEDGAAASAALAIEDNFFKVSLENLNFEQRFYNNNWSNFYGVFNTAEDENKFGTPIKTTYTKQDEFSFLYARKFGSFSLFAEPAIKHISYNQPLDGGSHNAIAFGASLSENMGQGANMGALFGFGLSDKAQSLKDLPRVKYGYNLTAAYKAGGDWSGADYNISKVILEAAASAELKARHRFYLGIKAQDSFDSPFSDGVFSADLLGGNGKYSRQKYGQRGFGFNTAFSYFLLRNNLGLLSLTPFYELAYIYNDGYAHHSGTGAVLAYKFWRFPFPIGLGYTHNLSDGSNITSFVIGAKF